MILSAFDKKKSQHLIRLQL